MNRRNNPHAIWVALGLLAGACAKNDPQTTDEASTGGDASSATTGEPGSAASSTGDDQDPSTAATSATTSAGATGDATTGAGSTDDSGGGGECDPQQQDCGEGEKCTAVAKTEGTPWDYNKCVPVMGDGQAGDLCDIEDNKYSGRDNCARGLLCMLSDQDGKGGVCIEFCSPDSECTMSDATCEVYNDGILPICLPPCDPLIQDCPEGQACYEGATSFVCFKEVAKPGMGGQGTPCMSVNICQKGFTCAEAATQPDCPGDGCCSAFCPVSEGDALCGPDLMCLPFFPEGMAPEGYQDVGICGVPQ
ncbi:MAG: ribulose phosphate epimerase [Myxococcales bacterium]|nr:ribulose phosphate epimerase [Myxococcales bacterium]